MSGIRHMRNDPSFSIRKVESDQLVLEVSSTNGVLQYDIEPEAAERLGRQLLKYSSSVLDSRRSSRLYERLKSHMVELPSGTFWMGAVPAGQIPEEEGPRHSVTIILPFLIGKTPVTQELYESVMGENPSDFVQSDNPVEMVSWMDAILFCNKLSAIESLSPAYVIDEKKVKWNIRANGYRLATEAEWEYALLAGASAGKDPGFILKEHCWYESNSLGRPQPVGQLKPNEWGLFDMQGNVFEWVWDYWGPYEDGAAVDPLGPEEGTDRVCRGGSWNRGIWFCRTTYRYADSPDARYNNIGFRIARHTGFERKSTIK